LEEVLYYFFQSRFVLVRYDKIWMDAKRYCDQNHTGLSAIYNETYQSDLTTLIKSSNISSTYVWIGGYRCQSRWYWANLTTGFVANYTYGTLFYPSDKPFSYTNWQYQPAESSGHCVRADTSSYYRGKWTSESCYTRTPFVCVKQQAMSTGEASQTNPKQDTASPVNDNDNIVNNIK